LSLRTSSSAATPHFTPHFADYIISPTKYRQVIAAFASSSRRVASPRAALHAVTVARRFGSPVSPFAVFVTTLRHFTPITAFDAHAEIFASDAFIAAAAEECR